MTSGAPFVLSEKQRHFLKGMPLDGSIVHIMRAATGMSMSLDDMRVLASELSSRALVVLSDDTVRLTPTGAALLLN